MRDDAWLEQRFEQIWQLFFPDVEKKDVSIRWKGKWKNKFGHISRRNNKSEIVVNKLFQSLLVPEDVIKVTIAHEICHYAHGFHSHLPQKYKHPHKGGVVDKELKKRGFSYMLKNEKTWQRKEWLKVYNELMPHKAVRLAQQPQTIIIQENQERPEEKSKQKSLFSFLKPWA